MGQNSLLELDKAYIKSILSVGKELQKSKTSIIQNYKIDLKSRDFTEAIINRLKAYYDLQDNIKSILNKNYAAPAADFFVETVLFYIKIFLELSNTGLEAYSEVSIKSKRGSIRPDISIWKGDELVAIIECKTQLGWNRDGWEDQYNERDAKMKMEFPDAESYLLVMTGSNWKGFKGNRYIHTKYFCLLESVWPVAYDNPEQILSPIELLFKQLVR